VFMVLLMLDVRACRYRALLLADMPDSWFNMNRHTHRKSLQHHCAQALSVAVLISEAGRSKPGRLVIARPGEGIPGRLQARYISDEMTFVATRFYAGGFLLIGFLKLRHPS